MKVLLAEDSRFVRIATEKVLTQAGHQVITAVDGDKALQMAREQAPALILLDMMLPKLSGTEVLKALKQDPATANIPVIVLSGLSQKNADQLKKDGAAGFIEKSDLNTGSSQLLAEIERILKA